MKVSAKAGLVQLIFALLPLALLPLTYADARSEPPSSGGGAQRAQPPNVIFNSRRERNDGSRLYPHRLIDGMKA